MDLEQVNLFVELVKSKSFSSVAKKYQLSTSTVSRKIEQLEESIGKQLIINTTRTIEITEVGLLVYKQLRNSLDQLQSDIRGVTTKLHDRNHLVGKLRIQLPVFLPLYTVTPLLPAFHDKYPDIDLEIVYSTKKPDMDTIDIAVINFPHKELEPQLTHLTTRSIKYCCTTDYIAKYGEPQTLEELNKHRFVKLTFENERDTINIIQAYDKNQQQEVFVNVKNFIVTNNIFHNYKMMLDGHMICSLLDIEFLQHPNVKLKSILNNYDFGEVKFYLVRKNTPKKQKIIEVMVEFLNTVLNSNI